MYFLHLITWSFQKLYVYARLWLFVVSCNTFYFVTCSPSPTIDVARRHEDHCKPSRCPHWLGSDFPDFVRSFFWNISDSSKFQPCSVIFLLVHLIFENEFKSVLKDRNLFFLLFWEMTNKTKRNNTFILKKTRKQSNISRIMQNWQVEKIIHHEI